MSITKEANPANPIRSMECKFLELLIAKDSNPMWLQQAIDLFIAARKEFADNTDRDLRQTLIEVVSVLDVISRRYKYSIDEETHNRIETILKQTIDKEKESVA